MHGRGDTRSPPAWACATREPEGHPPTDLRHASAEGGLTARRWAGARRVHRAMGGPASRPGRAAVRGDDAVVLRGGQGVYQTTRPPEAAAGGYTLLGGAS